MYRQPALKNERHRLVPTATFVKWELATASSGGFGRSRESSGNAFRRSLSSPPAPVSPGLRNRPTGSAPRADPPHSAGYDTRSSSP